MVSLRNNKRVQDGATDKIKKSNTLGDRLPVDEIE